MQTAQTKRSWLTELLIIAGLLCCTMIPFYKTILYGTPISKLAMLKTMDAVQEPTLCAPWSILDDLSSSMAHIPNELFVHDFGKSEIPLWNPLNGGGRPFVGEFQTLQFSLFHALFPASAPYAYNLGILFKLLLSASGAYLLARTMNNSPWSSFAAGLAYALCPHCLRFAELVDNYCFYPYLALVFLWFAKAPSWKRAIAAGLSTAAAAYNMHPETFACAAALSSILALNDQLKKSTSSKSILRSLLWIIAIAMISFCAAAPLVLPLLEFIANGSSYKFADYQIEHLQLSDFFYSLFLPANAGSSYIGIIMGLSVPLGSIVWWKRNPALLIAMITILLFSTRPGALEAVLSTQPLNYLLPEYTLYAALLLLILTAAAGLDELFSNALNLRFRRSALFCAAIPCITILLTQLPVISHILPRLSDFSFESGQPLAVIISSIVLNTCLAHHRFNQKAKTNPRSLFLSDSCPEQFTFTDLLNSCGTGTERSL